MTTIDTAETNTSSSEVTFSRTPIGSLNIEQDGEWLTFDPQPDITPLESVHLCLMMFHGMSPRMWDWTGYIKEKGLERHWRKK